MIKDYKLVSVSHKYIDTNELSKFILRYNDESELVEQLSEIKRRFGQDEILYLNTCNRIVFVIFGQKDFTKQDAIELFHHINPDLNSAEHRNISKVVTHLEGVEAVSHLFEVAASIDSLVVGEREIFRQFREAYNFSNLHQLSGDKLRILEQSTVQAAKDVYTNTHIGAKPVSVASLAIQEFLARNKDKSNRILLVGAGETNTKIGRFLKKHGYNNLIIFNRSLDNAKSLSNELDAQAQYLSDLIDYKDGFDAIFACTAAQDPIITTDLWNSINPNQLPKIVVDLSIPNNVATEVLELDCVDYISIDSIRLLAEENLKFRNSNISTARKILRTHKQKFITLYEQRKMVKAFSDLPQEINAVKERALNLVYKNQIDSLPQDTQRLIDEIATYMERKCVAVPMKLATQSVSNNI